MVEANLLEEDPHTGKTLDYQEVAGQLEAIRSQFEDDNHEVLIIGFSKSVGDIADGAHSVVVYFCVCFLITALLVLLLFGLFSLYVLTVVCLAAADEWQ